MNEDEGVVYAILMDIAEKWRQIGNQTKKDDPAFPNESGFDEDELDKTVFVSIANESNNAPDPQNDAAAQREKEEDLKDNSDEILEETVVINLADLETLKRKK